MKAAILAPGPTLKDTLPKDWDDFDKVVAVTDGIHADAPIDAWSFQEGPGHKSQHRWKRYGERVFKVEPEVWCVKGSADRWIHHWGIPVPWVCDEYSVPDLLERFDYYPKRWYSQKRKGIRPYAGSSTFYSIARLIMLAFKEIHLYGVDMDGPGNFDPRDGKIDVSRRIKTWWEERWLWERGLLQRVTKEAGLNGVEIVKHEAPYDIDEAREEAVADYDGWL